MIRIDTPTPKKIAVKHIMYSEIIEVEFRLPTWRGLGFMTTSGETPVFRRGRRAS